MNFQNLIGIKWSQLMVDSSATSSWLEGSKRVYSTGTSKAKTNKMKFYTDSLQILEYWILVGELAPFYRQFRRPCSEDTASFVQ